MRDRLRAALAEINQFTQNLETKVEERTQQLKAAQKKLLHSDRLASLGQLSASVAHEINNPDLRRAQPFHAAAAHAERRRHPARAASRSSASTWGR